MHNSACKHDLTARIVSQVCGVASDCTLLLQCIRPTPLSPIQLPALGVCRHAPAPFRSSSCGGSIARSSLTGSFKRRLCRRLASAPVAAVAPPPAAEEAVSAFAELAAPTGPQYIMVSGKVRAQQCCTIDGGMGRLLCCQRRGRALGVATTAFPSHPPKPTHTTPPMLLAAQGGVGKTSLSASLGVRFAERGLRTLVVSTDPAHSLGDSFAQVGVGGVGD